MSRSTRQLRASGDVGMFGSPLENEHAVAARDIKTSMTIRVNAELYYVTRSRRAKKGTYPQARMEIQVVRLIDGRPLADSKVLTPMPHEPILQVQTLREAEMEREELRRRYVEEHGRQPPEPRQVINPVWELARFAALMLNGMERTPDGAVRTTTDNIALGFDRACQGLEMKNVSKLYEYAKGLSL